LDASAFGHYDLVLTLREEGVHFYLAAWQRTREGFLERGAAIFSRNFMQLDIEVPQNVLDYPSNFARTARAVVIGEFSYPS
jgi:hypothetical protein